MSLSRSSRRPPRRGGGIPTWLVFLVGVALVLGGFYLWDGLQRFVRSGGLGIAESTQRAQAEVIATAAQSTRVSITRTPMPTTTPLPECQEFIVSIADAPNALVRELPSPQGAIVEAFTPGVVVCVLGRDAGSEYYTVDVDPATRRFEIGYMHESVLEAVNPTPTPSITPTPPPTITPTSTNTPAPGVTIPPSATSNSAQPTMPPAQVSPTFAPTATDES
jgi:hypothetical protein